MKFTPETLLQIYLDGSFTEEAQAEFDALMRKDPAFAEKVTLAVAERVGPLPDSTVDAMVSRLDGRMGDVWAKYKPSPLRDGLKWASRIVPLIALVAGLAWGVRALQARLHAVSTPAGETSLPADQTLHSSGTQGGPPSQSLAQSHPAQPAVKAVHRKAKASTAAAIAKGEVSTASPAETENQAAGVKDSSPFSSISAANPNAAVPGASPKPAQVMNGTGSSEEGDSLRVEIDTPQTQNVIVTIFDSNGLLIRHLYQGVLAAGQHYVDWDGKDEIGNMVLPGDYTVVLEQGGKKMSGVLKVLPNK